MNNFTRVLLPGYFQSSVPVFVKVVYIDGRLSITGVVGPTRSGNSVGGRGQIGVKDVETPAEGWTREMVTRLGEVWKRWHLNDMRAGCEHQRAEKWDELPIDPSKPLDSYGVHVPGEQSSWNMLTWLPWIEDPSKAARAKVNGRPNGLLGKPCPVCGYAYGTSWLREDVPEDILDWLANLPPPPVRPAWV